LIVAAWIRVRLLVIEVTAAQRLVGTTVAVQMVQPVLIIFGRPCDQFLEIRYGHSSVHVLS
jgi:hypothetical protein